MPRPKGPNKRRFTLVVTDRSYTQMVRLQKRIDADSVSEVIRTAVKVLDLVTDGGHHVVHTKSGNRVRLSM